MKIISFLIFILGVLSAEAYPNFIGYGYRNCLSCHESSTGGGALNDYGRGVFATEIAANPFSKSLTEDEAAGISNFLGGRELPWWVRLGVKLRGLYVQSSPNSKNEKYKYYNMQNELNVNLFANQAHTWGIISTLGYIENPVALYPNKTISDKSHLFMKEYFLKGFVTKQLVVSAGFMDKTLGLKTVNHTAVNRAPIELGQNNQVHGVLGHWIEKDSDYYFHSWLGNAHLSKTDRFTGGSFMTEQKWGAMSAYGIGGLYEKSDFVSQYIVEVHNKSGFTRGSALIAEIGYRVKKNQQLGVNEETKNYYIFSEGTLNLKRGYFLSSGLEISKNLTDVAAPDLLKWDIGFLIFPMQRFEFRFSAVNQKTINTSDAVADQWSLQSQFHVSL